MKVILLHFLSRRRGYSTPWQTRRVDTPTPLTRGYIPQKHPPPQIARGKKKSHTPLDLKSVWKNFNPSHVISKKACLTFEYIDCVSTPLPWHCNNTTLVVCNAPYYTPDFNPGVLRAPPVHATVFEY